MMIAVVLSANVRRMLRDNVLVRKPVGIEAAGSMNLLFTDKTGTLTLGQMRVGRMVLGSLEEYTDVSQMAHRAPSVARRYALGCRCNNGADMADGRALGGNATDRALLESAVSLPSFERPCILRRLPFDSNRKLSAVTLGGRERVTLIKGAPERLLPYVRYAMGADGRILPFAPMAYGFSRRLSELTGAGERVLLLAESDGDADSLGELTLICAVSLLDPLRPEAKEAVRLLQGAGIGVVMITGDNRETAAEMARVCGILCRERDAVLTGEELSALSDAALSSLLPRLAVVARALPGDKSRLVRLAQERELVVGMTGDGINDAPALKRADVGFAMGEGSQVAKDAGDVIILDNNVSSIARAVLYGRTVFKSIRKFITLQLTMNLCAVGISMIGPFVGIDAPVTVSQMLWINLIMDTLGGLAFAGEAPLLSYMKEKPKRRDEPILNGYMVGQIVFSAVTTVSLFLAFLLSPDFTSHFRAAPDRIYHLTAFFALFIFVSLLHCFHARTDRLRLFSGLGRNRPFLFIMLAVAAVQLAFVYVGGSVLRTAPLTSHELFYTLWVSLSVVPMDFARRLFLRILGRRSGF